MSRKILICQHKTCPKQGARDVLKAFQSEVLSDVVVEGCGCFGECGNGPMVLILPDQIWYSNVKVSDVNKIVEQHIKKGKPVKEKLYPKFHPQKEFGYFWMIVLGLFLGLGGLLFWLTATQTYYW